MKLIKGYSIAIGVKKNSWAYYFFNSISSLILAHCRLRICTPILSQPGFAKVLGSDLRFHFPPPLDESTKLQTNQNATSSVANHTMKTIVATNMQLHEWYLNFTAPVQRILTQPVFVFVGSLSFSLFLHGIFTRCYNPRSPSSCLRRDGSIWRRRLSRRFLR